ncbi:Mor transcription activator family protein [Morganella morganii]|uniref:Mor transcription activator family protein n=1 Tax=Morganella morganii TaxID=582 RepID=UPI0023687ADC|nr:Mor transcription activator family protein [Morganella morganii]
MTDLEKVEHLLPDTLRQIAALIGYPATLKLIDTFGGTTFTFVKGLHPAGLKRLEQLAGIVGRDAAGTLNNHFAGMEIYIPNASAAMREVRNQRFIRDIGRLSEQGLSTVKAVAKLCPEYGFSDRHAWDLLSRYKESGILGSEQQNLF